MTLEPVLRSSPVVHRYLGNPILSRTDIPYPASLIFNAGVAKYQGRYVMLFRNDVAVKDGEANFIETNLGLAISTDGIHWNVEPQPCFRLQGEDIVRAYDPRLTVLEGRCYLCFAVDTLHGIRAGIAVTEDFAHFEVLSLSTPDNRNMVLFPGRVAGKYLRLERPFPVYGRGGRDRFDIWYADSPDLRYWGNAQLVLGVEHVPYANDKIGPGAPPIQTPRGWLALFHAVDRDESRGKNGWEASWKKRYWAGLMLLDLEQPWKVAGMSKEPLLAPEAEYETRDGFRNHVIFPGGMILEETGEVKIYYGAADTVECLATADIGDLLGLCSQPR